MVRAAVSVWKAGRDVEAVEPQRHLVKRHRLWHAHLDQRVAAADVVRSVRKGQDLELTGCGVFCGCRDRCRDRERDEQRREDAQERRHDSSQEWDVQSFPGGGHFNHPSLVVAARTAIHFGVNRPSYRFLEPSPGTCFCLRSRGFLLRWHTSFCLVPLGFSDPVSDAGDGQASPTTEPRIG